MQHMAYQGLPQSSHSVLLSNGRWKQKTHSSLFSWQHSLEQLFAWWVISTASTRNSKFHVLASPVPATLLWGKFMRGPGLGLRQLYAKERLSWRQNVAAFTKSGEELLTGMGPAAFLATFPKSFLITVSLRCDWNFKYIPSGHSLEHKGI